MDEVCLSLNQLLWIDPTKEEDEIRVKGTMTVKEFRRTIIRHFFLSWTMCLSRISTCLNQKFPPKNPKAYYEKKLLSKREYNKLKVPMESNCWIEKWSTPLVWVLQLVNDIEKINKSKEMEDAKFFKVNDVKEFAKTILKFQRDLEKLNNYYEHRLPNGFRYSLRFAIFAYFFISITGAQDEYFGDKGGVLAIILDFPLFQMTKYILFTVWFQTAVQIGNAFCDDDADVNVPGFLNYEIWKASHMLAQKIPEYGKDTDNDEMDFGSDIKEHANLSTSETSDPVPKSLCCC